MTKIKILLGIILTLMIVHIFHFGSTLLFWNFWKNINQHQSKDAYFGANEFYIHLFVSLLIFFSLLFLLKGLFKIIKESYFNLKSYSYFLRSGYFLLGACITGIIRLSLNATLMKYPESQIAVMLPELLIGIIGFSLITISSILKEAVFLKQENELTI